VLRLTACRGPRLSRSTARRFESRSAYDETSGFAAVVRAESLVMGAKHTRPTGAVGWSRRPFVGRGRAGCPEPAVAEALDVAQRQTDEVIHGVSGAVGHSALPAGDFVSGCVLLDKLNVDESSVCPIELPLRITIMIASSQIEIVTTMAGVAASLLGVLLSALFYKLGRKTEEQKLVLVFNEAQPMRSSAQELEDDTRLSCAREELVRQESSARWNSRSAISLAISQYVVGGTLATSFIQSTLPEQAVGFLGLIVLLASIVYQRFRPDLRTSSARRRVAALKAVIRRAEDGLFEIREAFADAPTIQAIRKEVTNVLIQVEHSELEDNFLPLPSPADDPKNKDDKRQ